MVHLTATEKTMFEKLPKEVQDEIKRHLMANEFMRAKFLYDSWVTAQSDNGSIGSLAGMDLAAA